MPTYKILNADGDIVNTIEADQDFVDAHHSGKYERVVPPAPTEEALLEAAKREARDWRDSELVATDYIVPLTDHPQHAAYMAYRVSLRDWPAKNDDGKYINDFPNTRPVLGE